MGYEKTQTIDGSPRSRIISEFNYLKIFSLFLLILVHSDLILAYPAVMYPVQWFLLSAFFFISGYLAYESFHKRNNSIRLFFKSKAKHIYLPFAVAAVFYLALQVALGTPFDPVKLTTQVTMLNMFDAVNSVYNWGSLWFIPYLLAFMLIMCLLEKYVKNIKIQLLAITVIWLATILLYASNSPLRLGELFSQFMLVFIAGFYAHKLDLYQKILTYKMALFAIPLVIFFAFDLSELFNYTNLMEALKAQLYFNSRSIFLTVGLVLLALLFLRKIGIPKNGFAKKVAARSAFIYLAEPFISFLILNYLFVKPDSLFFIDGVDFYLYQAVRVVVLLLLVPLAFIAWNKFRNKGTASKVEASPKPRFE